MSRPAAAEAPKLILGIDPGLASVGWGVIRIETGQPIRLVAYGVIETAAGLPLARRLHQIHEQTRELVERHRPEAVSMEQLFFAKNAKTAMAVAHGRAASMLAAGTAGLEVFEYTPLQIKLALTGRGNAGKRQVQYMVRAVLGLASIPEPDHAADALAAAVCHAHSLGLRQSVARSHVKEAHEDLVGDDARAARKALLAQVRRRR